MHICKKISGSDGNLGSDDNPGSGLWELKEKRGGGMAVAPVPTPESHPKVRFAACVDAVFLFAALQMYGSTAAPLLQVLPRFAPPPTPLSRTPASYVWRFAFPPNMVVAGAAPPRSLRRVSAVSFPPNTAQPRTFIIIITYDIFQAQHMLCWAVAIEGGGGQGKGT
jgi:hypothetical protein